MKELLGMILLWIGLFFIGAGIVGTYRFKNFYPRILVASKIDTVGSITIILGVAIYSGFNFFTLKLLLLLGVLLVVNPLSTHTIARSAYFGGYKVRKE